MHCVYVLDTRLENLFLEKTKHFGRLLLNFLLEKFVVLQ